MDRLESDDVKDAYKESLVRQHILEEASAWLARLTATERFLKLIGRCLTTTFGISHTAVLVDKGPEIGFIITMSAGKKKIPSSLVKILTPSPLIMDLKNRTAAPHLSFAAQYELKRLHVELCIPIYSYHKHHLIGLLAVGPRSNGLPFEPDTIAFLTALANDIAVEVEKETYYFDSIHDPLTGLFNRKHLDETLRLLIDSGYSGRFAIALVDIDHFKKINDTYGHQAGDEVLRIVSEKMRRNIRKSDLCFRYGGEEFCILFRDLIQRGGTELETRSALFFGTVHSLAERLRQNIGENLIRCETVEIHVTISIGLSFFELTPQKQDFEDHLKEADELLYAAKHAGRNRVFLASSLF